MAEGLEPHRLAVGSDLDPTQHLGVKLFRVDFDRKPKGLENLALYQTAKAAIEGLTRSLARDLGRDAIRVNTIVPGNVQTPRQMKWYTPEGEAEIVAAQCLDGRIQPSDVAALALFLASDDSRYCTAHNYWVDAGWR